MPKPSKNIAINAKTYGNGKNISAIPMQIDKRPILIIFHGETRVEINPAVNLPEARPA